MFVLLSCAKTMNFNSKLKFPFVSISHFQQEATEIALHLSQFSVDELEKQLKVNSNIALENYKRFQEFQAETTSELPAMFAYTGMVFKRLNPQDFTEQDIRYAQDRLRLTSFVYGLLRPMDLIRPYRLEGDVRLPELGDKTMFAYWRPLLTDLFISEIKQAGGILCNLASEEMKRLFDWKRVEKEVKVITPEFKVNKNGKPKSIVIYAKMCRGEMARLILKNRIEDPEELKAFSWEGFEYDEELSTFGSLVFVNGIM